LGRFCLTIRLIRNSNFLMRNINVQKNSNYRNVNCMEQYHKVPLKNYYYKIVNKCMSELVQKG